MWVFVFISFLKTMFYNVCFGESIIVLACIYILVVSFIWMYVFLSLYNSIYMFAITRCSLSCLDVFFTNVFRVEIIARLNIVQHLDLMLCCCYVDVSGAMSMLIGYWLTVRRCPKLKLYILLIISQMGKHIYIHVYGRSHME